MQASSSTPALSTHPCLLFNEASGTAYKLEELIKSRSADLELIEVGSRQWRERAQAALRDGRRLIAAGGDGTVNSVAGVVLEAPRGGEMAIIPVGTGNDVARALDIPLDDLEAAADLAIHGRPRAADAVAVLRDGRRAGWFLNSCYGGFGKRVADQISPEAKARFGLFPHWIQLARQMVDMPGYDVEISSPAGSATLQLHGLFLANSCYLGGGVPAAPKARLNDGLINVALVPVQSLWERFVTSVTFLNGSLDEREQTLAFTTSEIKVNAPPDFTYTMDGEAAPEGPLTFKVEPAAIQLVAGEHPIVFEAPEAPAG